MAGAAGRCPRGGKRLLVLLALSDGRVPRRSVATTLWPTGGDVRATGNLRSALWRLRGAGIDLIEADKDALRLAPGTAFDLLALRKQATRLVEGRPRADELDLTT